MQPSSNKQSKINECACGAKLEGYAPIIFTCDACEAKAWNRSGAQRTAADIHASRVKSGAILPEYDVTVHRAGFGHFDVHANSENAQKLLGKGTFTYEESEWRKLNKELRNYTYTIEVL